MATTRNQKYWKNPDPWFFGVVILIMGFGLVAVSSASAVLSFRLFGNNNHYFFRQLIFAVAGFAILSGMRFACKFIRPFKQFDLRRGVALF